MKKVYDTIKNIDTDYIKIKRKIQIKKRKTDNCFECGINIPQKYFSAIGLLIGKNNNYVDVIVDKKHKNIIIKKSEE